MSVPQAHFPCAVTSLCFWVKEERRERTWEMGQDERSRGRGRPAGDAERGWEDETEGQGGRISTREERERVGQESSEIEAGQTHSGSNLH